jgi:hypothetical protein
VTELEFANRHVFLGGWAARAEPSLATGGAELLLELLRRFPQPNLETLCLANQALASDASNIVRLFTKLGEVAAAATKLKTPDITGFWDYGAPAGQALGRALVGHPGLRVLRVGMGELPLY